MIGLSGKILLKSTARLLIVASFLYVFFGNGVHVHAVFDHLFDHGDVHAFVHSHLGDQTQNHSHAEAFDDKDTHQHPTASVDLTGTLTQKIISQTLTNADVFSALAVLSSLKTSQSLIPLYLDLPPPDPLFQSYHFFSYSLRGPPLG